MTTNISSRHRSVFTALRDPEIGNLALLVAFIPSTVMTDHDGVVPGT